MENNGCGMIFAGLAGLMMLAMLIALIVIVIKIIIAHPWLFLAAIGVLLLVLRD